MKILVTGSNGFIARNLIEELKNRGYIDILRYDTVADPWLLEDYVRQSDFVFHLAGVNRPKEEAEFMEGNYDLTLALIKSLKSYNNKTPILMTSSVQAELDNPYGRSKKAAEKLLFAYGQESGAKAMVYRLPNVFGKWCKPNYNSVVATFCNNIANRLPIQINDSNVEMNLVYIDDVVHEFINALEGKEHRKDCFCYVNTFYSIKLGKIADLIYSFKESRKLRGIPDLSDAFVKKLYSTYLSYLPANQLKYPLTMNVDNRGSFTEFFKTGDRGQVSINISKPGVTKGNHWHHTKSEKFLVVSGRGVIRVRKLDSNDVAEYHVSGDMLEVVDIPPGCTHSITNCGETDMVTVMWANEPFNPDKPDTFYIEV